MPENKDMPKQDLTKSTKNEALISQMLERNKARRDQLRQKVLLAKQNTPDKQPFNIDEFGNLYNLRDDDGQLRITPELVEDYEIEYYVTNPDIKALEEFARHRKELDEQNST